MSSRLTAGLKNWGVGACPGAPACFLDHLHSMIGTKSFRNAKSHAAEHGLVLLGVIFFVAVSAPGLLAQTNALPAGAVNAQPPAGEPSTHITGSPGFGLPGGAPSSAIIGSPKTGLPAGVPFSAIMGSPTTWRPVRSPAGAMVEHHSPIFLEEPGLEQTCDLHSPASQSRPTLNRLRANQARPISYKAQSCSRPTILCRERSTLCRQPTMTRSTMGSNPDD